MNVGIETAMIIRQNFLRLYRNTMSLVDYRMVEHGERLAYMLLKILQMNGGFTIQQTFDRCMVAMLHDVGAYKTESLHSLADISELLDFELRQMAAHCAYGYLFVDRLLPSLRGVDEAILYHHTPYDQLKQFGCKTPKFASMLLILDRFDLFLRMNKRDFAYAAFDDYAGSMYDPELVRIFKQADEQFDFKKALDGQEYLLELSELFEMSDDNPAMIEYVRMMSYMIDYRSPVTVTHTITAVGIACQLGTRAGLSEEEQRAVQMGMLLHDLGKIVTPLNILEKPGRLTPYEFSIMKDHVVMTERILTGCIDQHIIDLAVRHHERMDGKGYHHGLRGDQLTMGQRILMVADMASALLCKRSYKERMPKQQVVDILSADAQANKLCPEIVGLFLRDYDEILKRTDELVEVPLHDYEQIWRRYPGMKSFLEQGAQAAQ